MKRLISAVFAAMLMAVCLVGCGNSNSSTGNSGSIFKKGLKASDLSIDDFQWETVPAKHNGQDCYTFSLTNNSNYDIIAVAFTYKVRDDVSDGSLSVYDDFMKDHDGYIDETDSPRDVILKGSKDALVSKGDQLTGLRFTVGFQNLVWYDFPTKEQFDLMEPKELEIGVIGDNNMFYIAYYSFVNETWTLDDTTVPADTWSEKEIAQKIGKPAAAHHVIVSDEEDRFEVRSYGVTSDEFAQYIEEVKNAGFEEDSASSSYFSGESEDGYSVTLNYDDEEEKIIIRVKK